MGTDKAIEDQLTNDGWAITSVMTDPGTYKTPSKHTITIKLNGKQMQTPYTMGAAYRVWSKKAHRTTIAIGRGPWTQHDKRVLGQPKPGMPAPSPRESISLSHEEVLLKYTEGSKPELAQVIYSLLSDAEGVRYGQTFEKWAEEYGLSPDSIAALDTFNACTDIWRSLIRLGADLDQLEELFQGY